MTQTKNALLQKDYEMIDKIRALLHDFSIDETGDSQHRLITAKKNNCTISILVWRSEP